jgi:hypothetical protein
MTNNFRDYMTFLSRCSEHFLHKFGLYTAYIITDICSPHSRDDVNVQPASGL